MMNSTALRSEWVGLVVEGAFPLLEYLGSTGIDSIFRTDLRGDPVKQAVIRLVSADGQPAERQLDDWAEAATFDQPNLMRIFDSGRTQIDGVDLLYVVTEYPEEALSQILPDRALSVVETGEMLKPILNALGYLHSRDYVLAQLTPANLLVVGDLLKLPVHGLYRVGRFKGLEPAQHGFDAPELKRGEITPAADVWSLGVTVVESLTQRPPEWSSRDERDPVVPRTVPQPFANIARQCLHIDPSQRCTLEEIAALIGHEIVIAAPPPPQPKTPAMVQAPVATVVPEPAAPVSEPAPEPAPKAAAAAPNVRLRPITPAPEARVRPTAPPTPPVAAKPAAPLAAPPASPAAVGGAPIDDVPEDPRWIAQQEEIKRRLDRERLDEGSSSKRPIFLVIVILAVIAGALLLARNYYFRSKTAESAPAPTIPSTPTATSPPPAPAAAAPQPTTTPIEPSGTSTPPPASAAPDAGTSPANPTPASPSNTKGDVLNKVTPDVSARSLRTIHGTVDVAVRAAVDSEGKVMDISLASRDRSRYFTRQAMEAARQWTFKPAVADGKAVGSSWDLHFKFTRGGVDVSSDEVTP